MYWLRGTELPVETPAERPLGIAGSRSFRILVAGSVLFALLPALLVLIANGYWMGAELPAELEAHRPQSALRGIAGLLLLGTFAEIFYFVMFFLPSLKLGRIGLMLYLGFNALASLWVSLIHVLQVNPANQGELWYLFALPLVLWTPILLGLSLLASWIIRWGSTRRRNLFSRN